MARAPTWVCRAAARGCACATVVAPMGLSCIALVFAALVAPAAVPELADRRVPDRPEIAFDLPVDSKKAINVLQRALIAAGVPSGIEQAPQGSDPEQFSRRPVNPKLRFNGRSVRDVLNDFVEFDPRYDWREADGRILIRTQTTRGSDSLLQTRLPDVEFRSLPLPEAMISLFRIALSREHSYMTVHLTEGEAPLNRRVSIRLRNPTFLDALNAVSRAGGSLSWTVSYAGNRATGDRAQISLVATDTAYVLSPPRNFVFEKKLGG